MVAEKADVVLHDGVVLGHPESDSVAIAHGRILAHGRYGHLKGAVGPRTHLIRLGGRTVAPGFIDSHLHFMEAAAVTSGVSVSRCRTVGGLLADLRVAAGKAPPGNWLRVFGCDEALMRERRGPTREELDQAIPKNPLRLRHQTLHASWLNTRAINLLGLEAPDFSPPPGAWIGRDNKGRVSGFVVAMEEWLGARLPLVTGAELEARARVYSRELAAAGVTAFTDATVRNGPEDLAVFARLAASGAITQRMAVMLGQEHVEAVAAMRDYAQSAGFALAGVKFMGFTHWEPGMLARLTLRAMSRGADCAFHATEVDELDAALSAIEATSRQLTPEVAARVFCRIEHGGLIPTDYPERIAAAGAWVVTNPGFLYYRGVKYAGEPGLIPYLYRAQTLLQAGVNLAAGSDAPVTPSRPLTAISAAITRVALEGYELALEERLTLSEAMKLVSSSAARLLRLNGGQIEPGQVADLIVLPSDPHTLGSSGLLNLAVDLTMVGGRVVYERGRPATAHGA
ncbi:MAG: amidohydrolase [Candidatus Binataceae bacterium]